MKTFYIKFEGSKITYIQNEYRQDLYKVEFEGNLHLCHVTCEVVSVDEENKTCEIIYTEPEIIEEIN